MAGLIAAVRANPTRYWLGKKRSAETNEKISRAKRGKPRPPLPEATMHIYRENMRRAAANRRRRVICINDGREFASAKDAAKAHGLHKATLAAVASGRRNSVYGLRFRYL
jgi:hypothetical protein